MIAGLDIISKVDASFYSRTDGHGYVKACQASFQTADGKVWEDLTDDQHDMLMEHWMESWNEELQKRHDLSLDGQGIGY